jgi:hypothetical protein
MGMTALPLVTPRRSRRLWVGALALALCAPTLATAQALQGLRGRIDADLAERMAAAEPGERIEVSVALADTLDAGDLRRRHAHLPAAERRDAVVAELKAHAAETQAGVAELLAQAEDAGRAQLDHVLWMGNALLLHAEPSVLAQLAERTDVSRIRAVRALSPEQVQDAPADGMGSYPFFDDFDSGALAPHWTFTTTGDGQVTISTEHEPLGSHHAVFDAAVEGVDSVASITVELDLAGETDVGLRFRHKEMTSNGITGSDESHEEDGVFISDDGVSFQRVLHLVDNGPEYEVYWLTLDDVVGGLGMSLTSTFHVRFQWRDNFAAPSDGMAYDVIEIGPGVGGPPPAEITPNLEAQQAPQLWALGVHGEGILVGSIDSGTWRTHPDLVNRHWTNPGEIPGNGQDDDANTFIDDTWGWDFENGDADPQSTDPHGTQSAGLIVGDGTSGTATGVAPGATLVTCQVEDEADYWAAQQYLLDVGVDVVSSSYSYKWPDEPDHHMFRSLCDVEWAAGIIHANSIGNQGGQPGTHPKPFNISTPGNVPSPYWHPDQELGGRSSVLGCGGLNMGDGSLYAPGGRGPSAWEDLTLYEPLWPHAQDAKYWDYPAGGFALPLPGLLKPDLVSLTNSVTTTTIPTAVEYGPFNGTSAATPQLGGTLCLLRQSQPAAEPRHLAAALQLTAVDLGPNGKDTDFGAGQIQAFDAARRLVVLAKAIPDEVPLGETTVVQVHGWPDTLVFGFLALDTFVHPSGWNLTDPFFPLPPLLMDGNGRVDIPFLIPNDVAFIDLLVWMQFGQKQGGTEWGKGFFLSVPEAVRVTP